MNSTMTARLLLATTCAVLLGCGAADTVETRAGETRPVMTAPAAAPAGSGPALITPPPTPEPFGPLAYTEEELRDYLGFSEDELALLTERERKVYLPEFTPKIVNFTRAIQDDFLVKREAELHESTPRFVSSSATDLQTDASLAPPALTIADTDTPYPSFAVSNVPENGTIFLEVDSDPEFRSLDLVRFPALASYDTVDDRVTRNSAGFQVFQARRPGWPEADTPFTLPFRSTAMALPMEDAEFGNMARFAQLVGHGLAHDDIIREVFELVSLRIDHGGASVTRPPVETFFAGIDECGHVNDLAGVLLEMNGIRYRGVAGFNPYTRVVKPGAGHSSIEVMNAKGNWEYFDAFLGHYTPAADTRDLTEEPDSTPFMWPTYEDIPPEAGIGETTHVGDIFRYRLYYDKAMRAPMVRLSELLDSEADYGKNFPIRPLADSENFDPDRDLPSSATLYARARYVVSDVCTVQVRKGCGDIDAKASPWTTESFTIAPRELVRVPVSN